MSGRLHTSWSDGSSVQVAAVVDAAIDDEADEEDEGDDGDDEAGGAAEADVTPVSASAPAAVSVRRVPARRWELVM
ncbi:hypothetical protein DY218_14605 [Streptomyces triticagri]|uniref:Uncharacterized protein n=1 Tax=Streptomyces triticagri TaxID=2293568 RepID=A0A372M6K2_9ACTN|nr:hypothetical protein DY218_14605 [Streptomyces triticagri]